MATVNREQRRDLEFLVNRLCDGLLADEELASLDQLIHDHPWARDCYVDQVQLHARLTWCSGYPSLDEMPLDDELLSGSSAAEDSPSRPSSRDKLAEPNRSAGISGKPAGPFLSLLLSHAWAVAASLVLVLLAVGVGTNRFSPSQQSSLVTSTMQRLQFPVAIQATLTRAAGVQWGATSSSQELGSCPGTQLMRVLSGRIQITFDNGVEVVVEGPAEFSHDGFGGVTLSFGTLTAVVPERVAQFSVYTSSAYVESLGSAEFGLVVKQGGTSELHVLEGTASFEVLRDSDLAVAEYPFQSIHGGQAVAIDRETQQITAIACDVHRFDRISSQCLDVVDLVSGGSGYGQQLIYGIHALSGRRIFPRQLPLGIDKSDGTYHSVDWNQYVDGVFAPRPAGQAVKIDSSGHVCDDFPKNSSKIWEGGIMLHRSGHEQPVAYGPIEDGSMGVCNWLQTRSSHDFAGLSGAFLGLHANCGLTLDLEKIRTIVPEGELHHFHAELLHIRPTYPENRLPVARPPVFSVFLDGKLHASYRPSGPSKPIDIDIPCTSGQRFLTVVATDGDGNISEDWMVLANPILKWVATSPDSI